MSASAPPRIHLEGVEKAYRRGREAPGAPILRGVDLEVAPGEFLVVVGASGSGKTTLLKIMNRLIEPDAGRVLIDGADARSEPPHELRRRIGYAFQGVGLFPHLDVFENIAATPRLLNWPRARVAARAEELLRLVDLPDSVLRRRPASLSGGQRQRVGLARALAAQPELVLLDEPFGALDPLTRDVLGREYRRIHSALALTTVMITHDMMEALLLADRVAVLAEGEILALATPEALLKEPQPDYVGRLLETPRRQAARVAELGGHPA